MKYILGIDPGVTGAYAILHGRTRKIKICKKFSTFQEVVSDLKPYLGNIESCLELVHGMPIGTPKTITKLIRNAGIWEGLLIAFDIPYTLVSPQKWPAAVFDVTSPRKPTVGITDKKEVRKVHTQNRNLKKLHTTAFVLRTFPESKEYIKLVKDQDMADALCIALYRLQQLHNV